MTLRSSRMLPGHGYSCISAIASARQRRRRRAGELREEMLGEQRDVDRALAQRRQRHGHGRSARYSRSSRNRPSRTACSRSWLLDVTRRTDDLDLLRPADAEEASVLQRARELRLELGARASPTSSMNSVPFAASSISPAFRVDGTAERAALVAEQLDVEHALGEHACCPPRRSDRRAPTDDESPARAASCRFPTRR